MLHKHLFRSTLLFHYSSLHIRPFSAMAASPPAAFTLDPTIFNPTLYTQIRDFWFAGVPENATTASFETMQRWFGIGRSEQEKEAFDDQCRTKFGLALDTIAPSKLSLPPFQNYEHDISTAETLAAPFLAEIRTAQHEDSKKGAETLLSLLLLLDQIPRNTLRDPAGLKLVYTHYDRLAYALLRGSVKTLSPNPLTHDFYRGKSVYLTWALLPLMHAEHLPSHALAAQRLALCRRECEVGRDTAASEYLDRSDRAAEEHEAVLRRFGRYPHRNQCLGRQDTEEEEGFLRTANTFGVRQVGRDEL